MNHEMFPATRIAGLIIFALLMLLTLRVCFRSPWRRRSNIETMSLPTDSELN
jgi:hypothetical protein